MSCIRITKTNKEPSILYDQLLTIARQDVNVADEYYAWFESDVFIEQFGDWKAEAKLKVENRTIDQRSLDDNLEPKLSYNSVIGFFFYNKQGSKVMFNPTGLLLRDKFGNEQIRSITKFLAFNFLSSRIDDNFNTLDLSSKNGSITKSIREKLESKIEEFIESGDMNQGIIASQLEETLPVINQWTEEVIAYYNELKLRYRETSEQEDLTEEENSERGFGKASFERSTKENVTPNVKLRLALLQNLDPNKRDPLWNEPTFVTFDDSYGTLLLNITDNVAVEKDGTREDMFEIYLEKIQELSLKKPFFKDLYRILSRKDLDINVKSEFVQAFNLHKNNFLATSYFVEQIGETVEGDPIYSSTTRVTNLSNVGAKSRHVKGNWQYNFKKKFMPNDVLDEKVKETFAKRLNNYLEWYNSVWKQGFRDRRWTTEDDFAEAAQQMQKFLADLGMDLNQVEFAHFLDGLNLMNISLEERVKNLDRLANDMREFYKAINKGTILSEENSPLDNQKVFKELAAAKAFYIEEGTDASVYATGKTKWIFSYPSYLSNKIKTWKKDRAGLLALYKSSPLTTSSHYMEYLLALDADYPNAEEVSQERLDNFELNVFNSLQAGHGESIDNKNISKTDMVADMGNKMLAHRKNGGTKSYIMTPTPADKSTLYQLTIPDALIINSNATYAGGKVIIDEDGIDILFNHVNAEYKRMQATQREINAALKSGDTSKLVVDYHFKILEDGTRDFTLGNGLKFQTFDSLNKENIDQDFLLYTKQGTVLLQNSLQVAETEEAIRKLIRDTVSTDIIAFMKRLVDMQLIQPGANGYINKGFDGEIFSSYKDSKVPALTLGADIYINSLIAQLEYSKMFSGDVAYYKDTTDYKKRIPATYTDGLQLYLRPDDDQKYMSSVIEGVIVGEPYIDNLREVIGDVADEYLGDINSTDAQAWITPERWKFLRERLGKFGALDAEVYRKMMSTENETYTPEELKRAAQPLKGVYFDINEGRPVYLKYSQAVLIPQMIKGTELQKLSDQMKKQSIDEVVTLDGVKVGAFNPVKTHNEEGTFNKDFTLTPMPLNNAGWKLQQDLPTKGIKGTDVGSQIQKIIFAGIANNQDKTFLVGDVEMTGKELGEHINRVVSTLSDKGLDALFSEFGVGQDSQNEFKITNQARLTNALVGELRERGAPRNVIRALESGASPFAIPGHQEKIQNVFASMVLKKAVKIQTNGGAFIQMSNYGMNTVEAEEKGTIWTPWAGLGTTRPYEFLKHPDTGKKILSKNGKPIIKPAGILISGSFIAQHVPKYREMTPEQLFGTLNKETGRYEGGAIDYDILNNIIGYRIPDQGLASNDALQVVGILPEESGDTVIAYTGLPKKTGSDFDIDKMYLMLPSFIPARQNANKIRSHIYSTLRSKTIQDTIDNVSSVLNQIDPNEDIKIDASKFASKLFSRDKSSNMALEVDLLVEAILKSDMPLATYIKENIPNYDKVSRLVYIKPGIEINEDTSIAQLQNMLIESYKAVMLHPDVLPAVMTPIDFDFYKRDIESMFPAEPSRDLKTFNISDEIDLRFRFMAGKAGVGQTANALVDHVRGMMATLTLHEYYIHGSHSLNGETKFDEEYSTPLSKAERAYYKKELGLSEKEMSELESVKIQDSLSALMNAYVDIAKDPYITRGNWTTQTANVGFMLIRAGVHPFKVNAFLAQPIIKEYSEFVANAESIIVDNSGDVRKKFVNAKIVEDLKASKAEVTINGITKTKARVYAAINGNLNYPFLIENIFNAEAEDENVAILIEEFKGLQLNYSAAPNFTALEQPISTLREMATAEDVNVQNQMAILNQFHEYVDLSKGLVKNVNASKSDVTGYGKNVSTLLLIFNSINEMLEPLTDKDGGNLKGFETKLRQENDELTLLGTYISNSVFKIKKLMQNNPDIFLGANETVFNTFNEISKGIYGRNLFNENLADKLQRSFYSYIMSGFPALQMETEEKVDMLDNMVEEFIKVKENNPNNRLLQELDLKIGEDRTYVIMGNRKKSPSLEADITDAWHSLWKDPDTKEFAEKLIKYSFATSAFQLNMTQFYTFIPFEWFTENGINTYIKQVDLDYKNMGPVDNSFIQDFFRHNTNDNAIVPETKKSQMGGFKKNSAGGFIKIKGNLTKYTSVALSTYNPQTDQTTYKNAIYELKGLNKKGHGVYLRRVALGYRDRRNHRITEWNKEVEMAPTIIPSNMITASDAKMRSYVEQHIVTPITMMDALPVQEDNLEGQFTAQPKTKEEGAINIYAGTGENAELSNFANRPFTANIQLLIGDENINIRGTFPTVEHAFQYAKGEFSDNFKDTDFKNSILEQIIAAKTAAEAKALGKKIPNLDTKTWDFYSGSIMKKLIKQSFEQNPKALEKLLLTGRAPLTHTQDKGKWGKLFPQALMEVRRELSPITTLSKPVLTIKIKGGTQLAEEDNPTLAYKLQQDLVEEEKKLNEIIKCLWKS